MTSRSDPLPGGVMFNAYPDSCGRSLSATVSLLSPGEPLDGAFSSFYILPSLYNSDLDRGFSVVDYGVNGVVATNQDLRDLRSLGIELKLDLVLNHISVQSRQFQDLLQNGDESRFVDFFVDWNKFWEGHGDVGPEGYVVPHQDHLDHLFMRKPGLPILELPFPDGTSRFYWNTFYQGVTVTAPEAADLRSALGLAEADAAEIAIRISSLLERGGPIDDLHLHNGHLRSQVIDWVSRNCTRRLGQMDLNAQSEEVWDYYDKTLRRLKAYGARIIRLDAFAYLHKEVGQPNFFNEPGTWEYLDRIKKLADKYSLLLLPEIHARYREGVHAKLAENGYAFYDFFFPGLVIDALEKGSSRQLVRWIEEVVAKGYRTVNMLGCHDGIPLLDVEGLLDDKSIDELIAVVMDRGGIVKNLYKPDGERISYYQVNATFYSALDENDRKMLLARAIQMFMPGVPQVWYLDLFNGTNDHAAIEAGDHKEINRTNLSPQEIRSKLADPVVQRQLQMIRFRNSFPAFGFDSQLEIADSDGSELRLTWTQGEYSATLVARLITLDFEITYSLGNEFAAL